MAVNGNTTPTQHALRAQIAESGSSLCISPQLIQQLSIEPIAARGLLTKHDRDLSDDLRRRIAIRLRTDLLGLLARASPGWHAACDLKLWLQVCAREEQTARASLEALWAANRPVGHLKKTQFGLFIKQAQVLRARVEKNKNCLAHLSCNIGFRNDPPTRAGSVDKKRELL